MSYARVTIRGTHRKADLALPSESPLEDLLPEIVGLLGEPPAPGSPLALTTPIGVPVDLRLSLKRQGIDSGAVLLLGVIGQIPRPPDVAEVTEEVGASTANLRDQWTPRLTSFLLSSGVGLTAALAGTLLTGPLLAVVSTLVAVFVTATIGAAFAFRHGKTDAGMGLLGLAIGVSFPLSGVIVSLWMLPVAAHLAAWWALIWLSIGVIQGVGALRFSVIPAAAAAAVLGVGAVVLPFTVLPEMTVTAVGGVLMAMVLGLVPSLALAAAGVTRLDDAATGGDRVDHQTIVEAVAKAHSAQTSLVLSFCPPLAACLIVMSGGDVWAQGLTLALAAFVLIRSRLFPGALCRIALLATGGIPLLWWLATTSALSDEWRTAITGTAALVLLAVTLFGVSAPAQARLRRLGSMVEATAVVATIPLILGGMGVYTDLLGMFS